MTTPHSPHAEARFDEWDSVKKSLTWTCQSKTKNQETWLSSLGWAYKIGDRTWRAGFHGRGGRVGDRSFPTLEAAQGHINAQAERKLLELVERGFRRMEEGVQWDGFDGIGEIKW